MLQWESGFLLAHAIPIRRLIENPLVTMKNLRANCPAPALAQSLSPSFVLAPLLAEIVLSSLLRAPPESQPGHSWAAPTWPGVTWFWCLGLGLNATHCCLTLAPRRAAWWDTQNSEQSLLCAQCLPGSGSADFPYGEEDKVKITVAGTQQQNIGAIVLWVEMLIVHTGVEEGPEGGD